MFRHLTLAALVFGAASSPALAGDHHGGANGHWRGGYGSGPVYYPPMVGAPYPTVVMTQPVVDAPPPPPRDYYPEPDPRWGEMNARCAKLHGDRGTGGAVLGGVVGGVVGNRIAGRGNRVLGTVAGAAVGAVAGKAIDKAEDNELRRECDAYFASLPPYPYPDASYPGYAPYGYVWVPVMVPQQKPCVETTVVTETWVDAPRRRSVPRQKVIREKRIKEKRVYTG